MMDIQTALVCVAIVIVSASVVYLTSIFGMREKTYEEALEEQRRSNNLESLIKPVKSEKTKKDKKEKNKKSNKRGHKDKESNDHQNNESDGKITVDKQMSVEPVQQEKVANERQDDSSDDAQPVQQHHHKDHVEFKPEIVILDENSDAASRSRKSSVSSDKLLKPILMNKVETQSVQHENEAKHEPGGRNKRANSFEQVHPKDEFELIKHREMKKLASGVPIGEKLQKHDKLLQSRDEVLEEETTEKLVPKSIEILKEDTSNVGNSSPRRSRKHKATNGVSVNSSELSSKRIADTIKNASLTNDEIQLLIDTLLNKQGDVITEWTKKSDPLNVLKKNLQEKEQALETETKNLQAAMARLRELRQELAQEKSKQSSLKEKVGQQQRELQTMNEKMQHMHEQHRNEVNSTRSQLQQMQAKISEERNVSLRCQDEVNRLKQVLREVEAERASMEHLNHLKHEVEQLRAERQQYERRQSAHQQANDELLHKIQKLEEHLQTIKQQREKEEYSHKQKISEVTKQLSQLETTKGALADELQKACNQCNSYKTENHSLRKRIEESNDGREKEINFVKIQLNELKEENFQLEAKLLDQEKSIKQTNGNIDDSKDEIKRLKLDIEKYENERIQLNNDIEIQLHKNDELRESNEKTVEALNVAEKYLSEKVHEAEEKTRNECKAEIASFEDKNKAVENKLTEILAKSETLENERSNIKKVLKATIPNYSEGNNLEEDIQNVFNEIHCKKNSASADEIAGYKQQLTEATHDEIKLKEEVEKYKLTLATTEGMLNELQRKVEAEEADWKARLEIKESEVNKLTDEKDQIKNEKSKLEAGLREVESLRGTINEMEAKLIELQSKLQGEENEKKILEAKYDEVNKTTTGLRSELDEKSKELESFDNDRKEIERIKSEAEEFKNQLEKEKKGYKELLVQNARLNSLVKIGQDALKEEQERVNKLEASLSTKNGSFSTSSNVTTSNGANESAVKVSDSASAVGEEGASGKK